MSTLDGNQIDADNPLAVAVISGGSTAHTLDGNLIDEDHPLAVAVVSGGGGGGSMTAPEIAAAGGMAVVAYKSADEAVNNSDVLQDDDALFFAVGANEVLLVRALLLINDVVTQTGYTIGWTGPALADFTWTFSAGNNNWSEVITSDPVSATAGGSRFLPLSEAAKGNAGALSPGQLQIIEGVYFGGANAGTLQLQWAQNAGQPAVGDTKILKGSHILSARLA